MLGEMLLIFFIALAVLALIGFLMKKRSGGKDAEKADRDRVTENVADLNDRFNRARYTDQDGK